MRYLVTRLEHVAEPSGERRKCLVVDAKRGHSPMDLLRRLRRHCASVLVDSGMSVVEVAKWLGDTPEQVAKTYARPMPSWEDKARQAVEAAWSVAPTSQAPAASSAI